MAAAQGWVEEESRDRSGRSQKPDKRAEEKQELGEAGRNILGWQVQRRIQEHMGHKEHMCRCAPAVEP